MDYVLNQVGLYSFSKKANKEIDSVGDDTNSLSTSIEGEAKWLVNKLKGKMQKPLTELLKEYDMALGISPHDATNYMSSMKRHESLQSTYRQFVKWATGTHLSCSFSPLLLGIWRKGS
ncbi:hypothetical protein CJ030_MR1G012153 [Morella rubra]|uniref:Uncharacterized protein n=1 Tax=Morella rubra TaxID=262757 RepID=A0A6A1WNI5_9ROSI|nr:hypothetical protein CJ030_MR1G012153 [Morella rubra]